MHLSNAIRAGIRRPCRNTSEQLELFDRFIPDGQLGVTELTMFLGPDASSFISRVKVTISGAA